jgi:flagellar hook-associated protein 3
MVFNTARTNIQQQYARLVQAQEEAASGKRVRRPSDDVTNTRRILSWRGTLAEIAQYKRNRGTLNTLLSTTDSALQSIGDLLNRAKQLTVQGSSDTLSVETRNIIATEVTQLFSQLVQTGNVSIGGRYLFAGRTPEQQPFEPLMVTQSTSSGLLASGTLPTLGTGNLTINDAAIRATLAADDTVSTSDNAASAIALARVINEVATTGVRAEASTTLSLTATAFGTLNAGDFVINGQNVTGAITDTASLVAAVNAANIPGVYATSTGANNLTLMAGDGRNLRLQTAGSVVGMNFTEFSLSGAALDRTTRGTVTLYSDAPIRIAGANPAQVGLTAGTFDLTIGGRFLGDSGAISLAPSAGQSIVANTVGSDLLVADLQPDLNSGTPLYSLRQGQGISAGSISITDRVGGTATINLSTAYTVGDVLTAISSAAGVNVTATLNSDGRGITITDDNATPTRNLTIQEVGAGTTASQLGILADRPGAIVGTPLQPRLTPTTPVSLLYDGQGLTLGSIHIANGTLEADVNLSSAQTIGDIIAAINGSNTNVRAQLSVNGTGITVRSTIPTTVAVVTEVNNGTTAAQLGIQGPRDVLKTLSLVQEALQQNDRLALGRLLQHLDADIRQVTDLRADVGARLNRVELVDTNQADLELTVTTVLSDAEDSDIIDAFSRLTTLSTAFEAALAASARTLNLSLLDFLR